LGVITFSSAAMSGPQALGELKVRLSRLRLIADGVDPADPCSREAAYGPVGRVYRYPGIVVATDGSIKDDGRIGAAFVSMGPSMGERLPARSVAVVGAVLS
jgi:hypothetical protein